MSFLMAIKGYFNWLYLLSSHTEIVSFITYFQTIRRLEFQAQHWDVFAKDLQLSITFDLSEVV